MSAIDTIARGQAAAAIRKFGKKVSYTATIMGARDPVTHSVSSATITEDRYVLVEGVSKPGLGMQAGTVLEEGDLKVSYAAKDYAEPVIGGVFSIDGKNFRVLSYTPVYSGTQVALYACMVKQ